MNNNMEGVQKLNNTEDETKKKEAIIIKEYARITTDDFLSNFLLENEKNIEEENFGPVYINLTNKIEKLIIETEKNLDKKHAKQVAIRMYIVLRFMKSFAEKDKIKDAGIKSKALDWLSKYIKQDLDSKHM